jgi:pyrimidine operon attenuation protein/uracil phosphoribosyltransferase
MIRKIMTATQVAQTLNRLAYEVVERNRGASNVSIFGILNAGVGIAEQVSRQIGAIENIHVPVHPLDISGFRDDTDNAGREIEPRDVDVTDRDVVLVDDVLFTGRTIRAALDAVIRYGRPRSIQLMVLIDRGHREYPIQPDYVGRTIVTIRDSRVAVDLNSVDAAVTAER